MTDNNALAALKRLFDNSEDIEVVYQDDALGDYAIRALDTCITGEKKEAMRSLGFKPAGTHAHTKDDGEGNCLAQIVLYVNDSRSDS
jgi:hypothetical protein